MDAATRDVLGFGLVLVLTGSATLLLLVLRELAPQGGLSGRGRWLLAAGLGSGVLAFAAKLAAIVLFVTVPERVITPLLTQRPAAEAMPATPAAPVPEQPARYVWQALPDTAPAPADNPTTPAKVALGERLFHDPALSRDRSVACSSCHDLYGAAGGDGRRTALGIGGRVGPRNTPTVWNAAFQAALFWDGRADSLERQALGPLTNPIEMGMPSAEAAAARLAGDPGYRTAFARAFGDEVPTGARIAAALAAYQRTLITPDTPYDRFVRGERDALSPAQLRGMALFEAIGCVQCHSGSNFSSAGLTGPGAALRLFPAAPTPYRERFDLGSDSGAAPAGSERGLWRVPSLRNVALTGPWLHNGRAERLQEVVRVMASAQLGRPAGMGEAPAPTLFWSTRERTLTAVAGEPLSDAQVDDIVTFLHALSSDRLVARRRAAIP